MRLRRFVFSTAAVFLISYGTAQAQQAPFAPIVLDEKTYTELLNYIGQMPALPHGAVLVNALTTLQRQAQEKAAAEAKAKKD